MGRDSRASRSRREAMSLEPAKYPQRRVTPCTQTLPRLHTTLTVDARRAPLGAKRCLRAMQAIVHVLRLAEPGSANAVVDVAPAAATSTAAAAAVTKLR